MPNYNDADKAAKRLRRYPKSCEEYATGEVQFVDDVRLVVAAYRELRANVVSIVRATEGINTAKSDEEKQFPMLLAMVAAKRLTDAVGKQRRKPGAA